MGSKLKMKAPKKNRVLECDNQMSQAFARAMQNSRKELESETDVRIPVLNKELVRRFGA